MSNHRVMVAAVLAVSLSVAGCGDDDAPVPADTGPADTSPPDAGPDPDAAATGAVARFSPPATGSIPWDSIPFPNDLFLGADGTADLPSLPSDLPVWESVREELNRRRGFCTTCGAWFPIDGEIDPASLPSDPEPGDEGSARDAIVLIDTVDGTFVPVRAEWNAGAALVVIEPARGHVLRTERTYAAALTAQLRSADGSPLAAAPLFAALRDGSASAGEEADRARPIVEPAIDALEAAGIERSSLVAVAAFTTGDPTTDARAVAEIVRAAAPPSVIAVDRVITNEDGALDELLGTPAEQRPGIALPAVGTDGLEAVAHDSILVAVVGRFRAPRVVERSSLETGYPRRGASGEIEAGPLQDVPFLLIVPTGVDVTSLPVVFFHHGLGGSMDGGFYLAETAARAGAAVIAIEPFVHGSRAAGAIDEGNALRGTEVPDGFTKPASNTLTVASRVLGLLDADDGREGSPLYPAATWLQMTSDAISLVRMLREGDVGMLAGAHAGLTGLAFDRDRVGFVGPSQGALVGTLTTAVSDGLAAAVLNVHPGSVLGLVCGSPEFVTALRGAGFYTTLGIRERPGASARTLCFHPLMKLYQWAVEIADPLAFAPVTLEPTGPTDTPDVLVQLGGHDELAGIVGGQSWVAAAAMAGVGAFDFADVTRATPPLRANVSTSAGDLSAGAWIFAGADHFMALDYEEEGLYEAPLDAPFVARATPSTITNPVLAVHAQILQLLRSRFETGRGEICDPAAGCPAW